MADNVDTNLSKGKGLGQNSNVENELRRHQEKRENCRSLVRICVTYGAAFFLFGGGALFIVFLIRSDKQDEALNLFNTILPVSASILAYWFAGRGSNSRQGKTTSLGN